MVLSEEVEAWYTSLNPKDTAIADRHIGHLAEVGHHGRMPRVKYLKDDLYELRFQCQNVERRITFTFEPEQRVVTLTTFRKQRQNERREVDRARTALKRRKP